MRKVHLIGGPQAGTILEAETLEAVEIPDSYRVSTWSGSVGARKWRQGDDVSCLHHSLSGESADRAESEYWREFFASGEDLGG